MDGRKSTYKPWAFPGTLPNSMREPPDFIAWYRKTHCLESMDDEQFWDWLNGRKENANSIMFVAQKQAWLAAKAQRATAELAEGA